MYVGATVGSNNTAELTALIEAALYALSQKNPPSSVTFYYDSKWAADTMRGRSKPKRHKLLVRQARNTLNALQSATTVNWSWVKGRSGDQGNHTADRLAEKGKTEAQYHGGRHTLPSMLTPSTLPQPDDNIPGDDVDGQFEAFYHATKRAQQTHFPTLRYTPSKPWITADLAQEIGRARHKRIANHHDHAAFYKEVKKRARKAKTAWLRDNLLKDTNTAHKTIWKQVQNFKRGFRAKHTRLKRLGRPVPWTSTHKVFKEHLETQQWGPSTVSSEELELLDSSPLIANPPAQAPEPFTLEEVLTALAKLRAGKAPGLDGIPADSLRQLDHTNQHKLLRLMNNCLHQRKIPKSWKRAPVVSIYKGKGADSDPASYRPISLLSAYYKLYAALLQTRIAASHDNIIRETQYGFRAKRGTQQPLFYCPQAPRLLRQNPSSSFSLTGSRPSIKLTTPP